MQNPSFEMHDTCPNMPGEIYHALNWYAASSTACNYFNSCAPYSDDCSVPKNVGGFQYAATGNGYGGIYSYTSLNVTPDSYTEIIGSQLSSPLAIGQKYYVKFKLNSAMGSNFNTAIDKMGVRFCNIQHNSFNSTFFNNFAHVSASFIVNDTTNWTDIFGSFTADSAYAFIEVGNFFDYQHVNKQIVRINGSSDQCFYFVDDICVSTDSLYTVGWQWTTSTNTFLNKEDISLFPNPSNDGFLYVNKNINNENVIIRDVFGNNISSFLINGNRMDLTGLENGIYFIQIKNDQNYLKQKIIIQKQ